MTIDDPDDLVGRRWLGGAERAWFFSRDIYPELAPIRADDARTEAIVVRLDGAVYALWPDEARPGELTAARLGSEACPLLPSRCAQALIRGPSILPPIECDVVRGERGGIRMTRAEDGAPVLEVDVDERGEMVVVMAAQRAAT